MKIKKKRLEKNIEQSFVSKVKKEFPYLRTLKLNVTGQRSWPDRMIPVNKGHSLFIEFKRPGEAATPLQEDCHEHLLRLGHDVKVFDDDVEAFEYLKNKISRIQRGV